MIAWLAFFGPTLGRMVELSPDNRTGHGLITSVTTRQGNREMRTYHLQNTDLDVSCLAYGCMKLGGGWDPTPLTADDRTRATKLVEAAREAGINFFDHADIYCRGKSETVFGEVLAAIPGLRDEIIVQSKCGIRGQGEPKEGDPGRYDFSYEHIVNSVEGSLRRLQTDRLDILLLHRPDPLVEPEEVARAFDDLHASGKVRYFGVSNHSVGQIRLLQKHVRQPLVANQLELNLLRSELIEHGVLVNQHGPQYTGADGLLDFCRLEGIRIQAWAPVANGQLIDPPAKAPERVKKAGAEIARLAAVHGTTREAIALGWLLRHPAGIQPIVGTTKVERLQASVPAAEVELSREAWYSLLTAARGAGMP
jgi:predicted oxidoreductase